MKTKQMAHEQYCKRFEKNKYLEQESELFKQEILNLKNAITEYEKENFVEVDESWKVLFMKRFREVKQMKRVTKWGDDSITYNEKRELECGEYCDSCSQGAGNCKTIENMIKKLATYEDLEEQGLLVRLPCKVGDIVYVDSAILPIEDIECYEDIGNKIPSYFQGRVVSFRFAKRNWVKIAVKAKWLHEWIDDETGLESDYIECEKYFSILLSTIGKTVFLTREEADKKLEELKHE